MTDLAWRDLGGTGDPFLLIHGYTGSSDDFVHVVEPLTELRRILVVDLHGHGNSPRLESYTADLIRAAVVGFIGEVVGEPVDLLGHSMGGWICLPIALERPDLVRSLMMMDTWADAPDLADVESSPEPELTEAIWGASWVEAHTAINGKVDPLAMVELAADLDASAGSLLGPARAVACPTTVVVGEHDLPFRGPSDRLAAAIPDAELVIIAGAYHSPQLTHPGAWQAAIARHLGRA